MPALVLGITGIKFSAHIALNGSSTWGFAKFTLGERDQLVDTILLAIGQLATLGHLQKMSLQLRPIHGGATPSPGLPIGPARA